MTTEEIKNLELEKATAISIQQYDRAAQIIDQITTLTSNLEKLKK